MAGLSFLRPLVAVAVLAGLLTGTVLTATAASEGDLFNRSAQRGASLNQTDGGSDPAVDIAADPAAGRYWLWHGYVGHTGEEDGHFYLKTQHCGVWVLSPANDDMAAKLREHHGERVIIAGSVVTVTDAMMRPTIDVVRVYTDRADVAPNLTLFPRCVPQPEPPAFPGLLTVLKRLGLQGLYEVPPGQRFDHFYGAEITFLSADGVVTTAKLTAGTVLRVGETALSYQPNGANASVVVEVTEDTKVFHPRANTLEAVQPGDKVFVLQVNGETTAIVAGRGAASLTPERPRVLPAATVVRPAPLSRVTNAVALKATARQAVPVLEAIRQD